MKERQLTDKIIVRLRAEGFYVWKQHGGPMQIAGLPDIFAVKAGQLWAFEVKRKDGKTTALQEKRLRDLEAAGAMVFVVRSVEELEAALALRPTSTYVKGFS